MTGINALSTRGAIKGLDDGTSSLSSQPSTDSAAMMFAAIFGGWLNQVGQGQDSGNQSNEPAGKEANSGRHALMGLDGLQGLMGMLQGNEELQEAFFLRIQGQGEQGANSEQLKVLLTQLDDLRSQAIQSNPLGIIEEVQLSGMTGQPQGKNAPQSELDLYKNVISNLLKEMSGEMKIDSPNPKDFNVLAQQKSEIAAQRYNSGLFIGMDGEGQPPSAPTNTAQTSTVQSSIIQTVAQPDVEADVNQGTILADEEANQGTILAALSGKSKPGSDDGTVRDENLVKAATGSGFKGTADKSEILNLDQKNLDNPENFVLLKQETSKSTTSTHIMPGGKMEEEGLRLSKEMTAKGHQENNNTTESSSAEKSTSQGFSLEGTGLTPVKDISQVQGKVLDKNDQPMWNQVAREIFDKAYQARPHLREMTIQLHPAELGQINISMSWEEGQVHLRMVTSDAGTGQMLQANFAELRDNLTQLGIQCGMMEMGLGEQKGSSQDHQRREDSARPQENGNESLDFLNSEELERMIEAEVGIQGVNRINVTA